MKCRRILLPASMLLLIVLQCGALLPLSAATFPQRHYTVEDGLPHSNVLRVFQDRRGFIWFGTQYGVARFDGKRFEKFDDYEPFRSRQFLGFLDLPDGRLLINTYDFNLHSFRDGVIEQLRPRYGEIPEGIVQMCRGADAGVWLNAAGSLYRLRNDSIRHIPLDDEFHLEGIVPRALFHIELASDGTLFVCTSLGLYAIRGGRRFRPFADLIGKEPVFVLREDREGTLWLGMSGYAYRIGADREIHRLETPFTQGKNLKVMMPDSLGNVWVSLEGGYLGLIEDGTTIRNLTGTIAPPNAIVNDFLADREGNIWLGTYNDGAYCVLTTQNVNYTREDGLVNTYVQSFAEDRSGRLWAGTFNGLHYFENGRFYEYQLPGGKLLPNESSFNLIESLAVDSSGRIQVHASSYRRVILESDPVNGLRPTELTYRSFLSKFLYVDQGGKVFTPEWRGLRWLRDADLVHFDSIPDLASRRVFDVERQPGGRLWIATDSGLYSLDTTEIQHYSLSDGLPGNEIKDLCIDERNRIWIASNSGAACFEDGRWRSLTPRDGLSHQFCTAVADDRLGNIWIGTISGLNRLNDNGISSYTVKRGLVSDEVKTLFVDSRDNLWVGTSKGISRIALAALPTTVSAGPPVYIVRAGSDDSTWRDARRVQTSFDRSSVSIEYAGLAHSYPEGIEFQYQLAPADADWRSTRDWKRNYDNLSPGSYRFMLRARMEDGAWSAQPAHLAIEVTPPFWMRWWFLSAGLGLLLGIVYGAARYRTNVLRRRELEKMSVQNTILQLEQRALNSSVNPHFLFNALNSIQYFFNKRDALFHANVFLSKFGKLIRLILKDGKRQSIFLEEELLRLRLYLELEKMRLEEYLEWSIRLAPDVETDTISLPVMIIQPYVENAIWHGISPLKAPGRVDIHISMRDESQLQILICDNGIGMDRSAAIKSKHQVAHDSQGMQLTRQRIDLHKRAGQGRITVEVEEADPGHPTRPGTKVSICISV